MQILQETPSETLRERNTLVLSFPSSFNLLPADSYLAHILGRRALGMKLQDCRPTRDGPDVCHMAQFITSNPHGPVELWSESNSSKCRVMTPNCSSNLDLSMFLSPASKSKFKTHNLVWVSATTAQVLRFPWTHYGDSFRKNCFPEPTTVYGAHWLPFPSCKNWPPPWRQNGDPGETIGPQSSHLTEAQSIVTRVPRQCVYSTGWILAADTTAPPCPGL